jgi:N-acetylglucosaminyldiphosphoundecaprenol N-acetyl-beta-D-mannosaminyltransferase
MKDLAMKVKAFDDQEEALSHIKQLLKLEGVKIISFLNAHACNLVQESNDFEHAIMRSDLLLRDGVGVTLLMKTFGRSSGFNANGTDFIPSIIESNADCAFAFIGTKEPYISRAHRVYTKEGYKTTFFADGFSSFDCYLRDIERFKPDVLVLGMGMPRQELFSLFLQENYSGKITIVNGGAIFDFIAGRFNRAPVFFRVLKIEWLYRLLLEPVRLFKRYVIGIPVFLTRLLYAKFKN